MNTQAYLIRLAVVAGLLTSNVSAQSVVWEAFNDHRIGADTSPNATTWEMWAADPGGPLKNIATGTELAAAMMMEVEGGPTDNFGANATPDPGTPAALFFAGKCTIGGPAPDDGIPGVRSSSSTVLRLRFTNLDPAKRYRFRGTTCRGNTAYVDRWSIFKIIEADGSVPAHVDASPNLSLFTAATFPDSGILPDEVALNSGNNLEGSLVGWDNINPGADGTFAIDCQQYIGTAPFGSPSAGPYGYGLSAVYLAELGPTTGVGTITNVSTVGGKMRIEWTGAGVLQSSGNLAGWADIIGATSPYDASMEASRSFFRLRE
jgi:hypothetical protein